DVLAPALHAVHELVVGLLHRVAHQLALTGVPRTHARHHVGEGPATARDDADLRLVVDAAEHDLAPHDADAADDAGWLDIDPVAPDGAVVPAAGGHVADAHPDGLDGGDAAQADPHRFARDGAASRRIDADDDALDELVVLD